MYYSLPASEFTRLNQVPPKGAIWVELDTGLAKRGDGATTWNNLPYWPPNTPAAAGTAPVVVDTSAASAGTATTFARADHKHAITGFAALSKTVNAQTGTSYTLALTDNDRLVTLTNASAVTVTVPANATVAFPIGSQVYLQSRGAGLTTVAAGGAAVVRKRSTQTLVLREQYSMATLFKVGTDEWYLSGDLT